MILGSISVLERVRSISFAALTLFTVAVLVFNVATNPTDSNIFCYSYTGNLDAVLTIGLWILAIAASLGALSATYHQLRPVETYKRGTVWVVYLASVPALLLLPSSQSISEVAGACATTNFFTYLSWYMMGVISAAALCCIHLLVHGVKYHQNRAEDSLFAVADSSKKLHEYTQKNAGKMTGTIKQLRTPLTNLRVQIESLLENNTAGDTEQTQTALLKINDAAKGMAMTIETHLDLTKVEAGHLELNMTDINLRDTVEIICDELRPGILRRSLILLMRTNLTSQSIVHADRTKVHQILRTLITQAQENTGRGTITAFVRDDADKKQVYLDILDTGNGMAAADINTTFSKPSDIDPANKTCSTNLKLCLAQKLAQAMGGTITAHSEGKGKGSRFTLVLPLEM